MQKRQILVVVVVLAGVSLVVSDEDVKPLDFYKYSLQWPPSACMQPPPGKKCEVRHEARFTIHGYWPQYNKDTPVPPYCDDLRCTNTKPTSANDVVGILEKSPLKKDLMKDWPNLYARQIRKEEDNLEFWKYEWRKHGMCSDDANKPSEYFRNSLTLLPNFKNLKQDLGFKPRSKVGDILKNLRDNKYKVPQIVCNSEKASQAPKEDRKPIPLIVKLEEGSSPLDPPSALSQGSLDVSEDTLQSNLPHL
ncbi:hypothetical protein V6Z12_D10G215300 [Gossypium hirsutum]